MKGVKYNSRWRLWGWVEPRTRPILWNIKLSVCSDHTHSLLTTSTNGAAPWNIAPLAWTHLASDEYNKLTLLFSDSQYIHHFIVNKGDRLGGTCYCILVRHWKAYHNKVSKGWIHFDTTLQVCVWLKVSYQEAQYVLIFWVFLAHTDKIIRQICSQQTSRVRLRCCKEGMIQNSLAIIKLIVSNLCFSSLSIVSAKATRRSSFYSYSTMFFGRSNQFFFLFKYAVSKCADVRCVHLKFVHMEIFSFMILRSRPTYK